MLLVAERAIRPPPRYLASLPWIGPIRGERVAKGAVRRLRVAAAALVGAGKAGFDQGLGHVRAVEREARERRQAKEARPNKNERS